MAALDLTTAPLDRLPGWLEELPGEVPGAALEAARGALEAARGLEEEGTARRLYGVPAAVRSLAAEVVRELPTVAEEVRRHGAEGLARWLEPRAPRGAELATRTREQGAELSVRLALVRIAYVLWWERVRGARVDLARQEEEDRRRRAANPPALPLGYLEPARAALWSPGRTVARDGSGILLGADGSPVGRVSAELAPKVAVWLGKAGGVTPLRVFRWALKEVTRQWADLDPRPEELWISGGRTALADRIGIHHTGEVTAALELGQCVRVKARGWTFGGLWTWSDRRGTRHGKGRLRVTLARELAPRSPHRSLNGRDSYLVPFPDREPPLVGSPGERGALLALQHVFMAELRVRSRELRRDGAIRLDLEDWRRLAKVVGLRTPLERVLGAWRDGKGDAPPFLAQPEEGAWTLAADLEPLVRFILEGEERSESQRRRALAGQRKRKARRERR